MDFGAVGDGVTDDTAAIQAAIASGARKVCIPEGDYVLSGTLTLTSGVSLVGTAAETTILRFSDGVEIGILRSAQQSRASIESLSINMAAVTNNCVAIFLSGCWRNTISRCYILGPADTDPSSGQVSYGIAYRSLYSAAYVNIAATVALDALHPASNGVTYGVYYNTTEQCKISNFGYGILLVSAEDGGSHRLNQDLWLNINAIGNWHGLHMNGCGGGQTFINASFESCDGDAIATYNQSAGTAPMFIGGELSSSGTNMLGSGLAMNVVGLTDPTVNSEGKLGSHIRGSVDNYIVYGTKPTDQNSIADEFSGTNVTIAASATLDVTALRSELGTNGLYLASAAATGVAQTSVANFYARSTSSTVSVVAVSNIGSDLVWATDGSKVQINNTDGSNARTVNYRIRRVI